MMPKYIVAQTQRSDGILVLESQHIGEVEVYVEFTRAADAAGAARIADALNAAEVTEVGPAEGRPFRPLYAGTQPVGVYIPEPDAAESEEGED